MSQISEVLDKLDKLDKVSGVKGTALLTADGMMVASRLGEEHLDDVVAGLSSFLISTTRRSLKDADLGDRFTRFVLDSTHGKVVIFDLGESFLVVITDQFINLQGCLVEVQAAATKLRKVGKIEV
jgi:predicted regulator of Ras-like GTPase activity (Roadblock/LC7/MglB family)